MLTFGITVDFSGAVYTIGYETTLTDGINWITRKSATGASGTFATVDSYSGSTGNNDDISAAVATSPVDGSVYITGYELKTGIGSNWITRKSATGASGTFATVDFYNNAGVANSADHPTRTDRNNIADKFLYVEPTQEQEVSKEVMFVSLRQEPQEAFLAFKMHLGDPSLFPVTPYAITSTQDGVIYYCGSETVNSKTNLLIKRSTTGAGGTWNTILSYANPKVGAASSLAGYGIASTKDGTLYVCGKYNSYSFIFRGKLSANSASLGPITFASSYGYVKSELSSTLLEEAHNLGNVSEFPHSSGIFQMKNISLGTQSRGTVGKSTDNIIQIKHFGSYVRVFWPKQDSANDNYKGYGDVSAGQRIGKLTTNVEYGDFYDVTDFDHLSLYCYLRKEISGTLDDIVITVERRPLKTVAFATDQTISYSTSGSITEGRLRDLNFVKSIDYGDLSIREVGFPIDFPLTNTREIRITARHKNGQIADENKNCIVWGRLIKADKNNSET
jgi:hypothetical protein